MHIAVIGCGAAGLGSIPKVIQFNLECTAFEMTGEIGGLWRYTEEINLRYGSPLYASLRTNLPAAIMDFGDFKFEPKSGLTFPSHPEVQEYLEKFAEHYNLRPRIKFHRKVVKVSRVSNTWQLKARNLLTNENEDYEFDGVMICSGHFSKPIMPDIPGSETFSGIKIHSVDYRRNSEYEGKKVLIVGTGGSGLDIGQEISEVAHEVIFSYSRRYPNVTLASNVKIKPKVHSIDFNNAHFIDETSESVDAIIYCTGYKYSYPYLDPSCGLEIEDELIIKPLFEHIFNIHHPSMCFIGLIRMISFILFNLQAEVYMNIMTNKVQLPSRAEMLNSWEAENEEKLKRNLPKTCFFFLGDDLRTYMENLAEFGKAKPVPPVFFDIMKAVISLMKSDLKSYRKHTIRIVDANNFLCSMENIGN